VKVLRLPDTILALIFDLDGTLYTNPAYGKFQETSQVARLALFLGVSEAQAQALLDDSREALRLRGQPKTSMANHFLGLGVGMEDIVAWREEAIVPRDWLVPNPRLDAVLAQLGEDFRLAILTNNPRGVGRANLEALGVAERFELVVGLDDSFESKPARAPFLAVCARLGLEPESCVSIGDREDVDLATPLDLGMGAILVDGVEDVYRLPEILRI
jgi:phosphoglycolate phosphatase/putative hydrolase of the HAD superfamily